MEIFTKDRDLTKKENLIKRAVCSGNKIYFDIFNLVYNYYRIDYLLGRSNYYLVFNAVYIENKKLPNWELADYCHICKTSLFNHRNSIINDFYTCLNNNIVIQEVAVTKE